MTSSPPPSRPHTGSHDLPVPAALDAFMATGWAPSPLPADARVPGRTLLPGRIRGGAARWPRRSWPPRSGAT
ncbi:hypothetical protein SCALM49S_06763 [Streptomyces californicus]